MKLLNLNMRVSCEYRSTSKDVFKRFQEKHPEINITYTKWCDVIYSFNYAFRDYILETGHKARFPYGFGEFTITKYKPKVKAFTPQGEEVINLPINWKKTKEEGKKIYHMNYDTEGFKFKWKWIMTSARFEKAHIWNFKPSRVSSRLIKHYLTEYGNQHIYMEWRN